MATAWITGVCLRPNRLEWTVLRRAKEVWEIAAQGREDVPAAEGDAGWIPAAALKARLKSFRGRIAVALPTDRALLRVALLPSTDADELRGMAELQTDKFSPFPVETVAAGAEVLEAAGTSSLVALAVVRREDVEAVGAAFQGAGAPPDVVDVEALGWWWALKQSGALPAHGSQLALRAEPSGVDMAVVRDGAPLAFRALPVWPAAGDEAARTDWIGACAEEMADALTALETEWGGTGAPTLHVFHAAEFPAENAEALRRAAGLDAAFAHPLDGLPSAAEGVARRQAAPARPLAMDLAPETWRTADADRRTRRRLLRAASAFGAVWLLALAAFGTSLHLQRGRLARLAAQVGALEGPALEIRRLQAKSLEFAQYADRTHAALECLRVISAALPEGVDLTSFVYRKGATLALRGEADAADKVYAFIQALEQAALFPEVKSEGISTRNTPVGTRSQFGATVKLPGAGGEGEP
jgi:Tfp pilus assembly protein PilN